MSTWEEGSLRMNWVYVHKALTSILAFWLAFAALTFFISLAADMAGAGSFQIAIGPVEFYRFVKEPDGFLGTLGGGGFWLAVVLGLLTALLPHILHRAQQQEE